MLKKANFNFDQINALEQPLPSLKDFDGATLDETATALKFGSFPAVYNEYLEQRLVSMLLHSLKLHEFVKFNEVQDKTMKEFRKDREYSGLVFTYSYRFAMKHYGLVDKETNLRVPFLRLFLAAYNKKRKDILTEYQKEQQAANLRARVDYVKDFVKTVLTLHGYEGELPKVNYLNREQVLKVLSLNGATTADLVKAEYLLSRQYHLEDIGFDKEHEEAQEGLLSEQSYAARHELAERMLDTILQVIDLVEAKLDQKQAGYTARRYAKYWLTLQVAEYTPSENLPVLLDLYDRVDKKLLELLEANAGQEDQVTLLTKYLNQQREKLHKDPLERESVRKNLAKARKLYSSCQNATFKHPDEIAAEPKATSVVA